MKRTMLLLTAALLSTVAAAKAQDAWATIDSWQYTAKNPAFPSMLSANPSGTVFAGGHAMNGTAGLGVVKVYAPSDISGQTGGRVLFANPGTVAAVAAGANGDVYFTGDFPDATGVYQWTVLHCTADGQATWYPQTDGKNGWLVTRYSGKVYAVGSSRSDYILRLRVFTVGAEPSSLTLQSEARLLAPAGQAMYARGIAVNDKGVFVAGSLRDPSDSSVTHWMVAHSTDDGASWSIIDADDLRSYGANALTFDDLGNLYAAGEGPGSTWQVRMYKLNQDPSRSYDGPLLLDCYLLQPALDAQAWGIGICRGYLCVAGCARDYDVSVKKGSKVGIHMVWKVRKASLATPTVWVQDDSYWPASAYPNGYSCAYDLTATADRVFASGIALEFYPSTKKGQSPTQAERWVVRSKAPL